MWTTRRLCEVLGVTKERVSWLRLNLPISPLEENVGTGKKYVYSESEAVKMQIAHKLFNHGFTMDCIRKLLKGVV